MEVWTAHPLRRDNFTWVSSGRLRLKLLRMEVCWVCDWGRERGRQRQRRGERRGEREGGFPDITFPRTTHDHQKNTIYIGVFRVESNPGCPKIASEVYRAEEFLFLSVFSVLLTGTDYIKLISKTSKKSYIHWDGTVPERMHDIFTIYLCCKFYDKKLWCVWVDVNAGLWI